MILSLALIFLSSCGKVKNSSTSDLSLYGSGVSGSSVFLAARGVLATHCLECHADWANYSEADYTSKFLVVKSDPAGSPLYTKIRGNDAGIEGNMPENRPDLGYEDLKKIKDWITSL